MEINNTNVVDEICKLMEQALGYEQGLTPYTQIVITDTNVRIVSDERGIVRKETSRHESI